MYIYNLSFQAFKLQQLQRLFVIRAMDNCITQQLDIQPTQQFQLTGAGRVLLCLDKYDKLAATQYFTGVAMAKKKKQVTPATRELVKLKIPYESCHYKYEEKGGTLVAATSLGLAETAVIKTLVMEDENHKPLIILMHGDQEVSTKQLARQLSCKQIAPCNPKTATKHTGYLTGGTSPFGTRKKMKIYIQKTIFDLDKVYINGGLRGFLVCLSPEYLNKLDNQPVDAAY